MCQCPLYSAYSLFFTVIHLSLHTGHCCALNLVKSPKITKCFKGWVQNLLLTWQVSWPLTPSLHKEEGEKKNSIPALLPPKSSISDKTPKMPTWCLRGLICCHGWTGTQTNEEGMRGCLNGPHNQKLVILTNRQADTQWRVTTVTQSLRRKPSTHSQENKKDKTTNRRDNWEDPMHC